MIFQCFVGISFLASINTVFLVFVTIMILEVYMMHNFCTPVILAQRNISLELKGNPILTGFSDTIKGIKQIKAYNLEH